MFASVEECPLIINFISKDRQYLFDNNFVMNTTKFFLAANRSKFKSATKVVCALNCRRSSDYDVTNNVILTNSTFSIVMLWSKNCSNV